MKLGDTVSYKEPDTQIYHDDWKIIRITQNSDIYQDSILLQHLSSDGMCGHQVSVKPEDYHKLKIKKYTQLQLDI